MVFSTSWHLSTALLSELGQSYTLGMHRDQNTDTSTLNAYAIATGTCNSTVPLVSQADVSTKLLR